MKHYALFIATVILYIAGIIVAFYYFSAAQQTVERELVDNLAEQKMLQTYHAVAALHDGFNTAQLQLSRVAQSDQVRSGTPDMCNAYLGNVAYQKDFFLFNLVRTDSDGKRYCSSNQRLVETNDVQYLPHVTIPHEVSHIPVITTTVAEYNEHKQTQITMHLPVFDETAAFHGFIGGSFYLDEMILQSSKYKHSSSAGEEVVIFSQDGMILYHSGQDALIGKNLYEEKNSALSAHKLPAQYLLDTIDNDTPTQFRYLADSDKEFIGNIQKIITPSAGTWYLLLSTPAELAILRSQTTIESFQRLFLAVTAVISSLSLLSLIFILRWSSLLGTEVRRKIKDIEKEKETSRLLAQDLQKFKMAVDSVDDHVVITDKNGTILYANSAVKKTTGFNASEIIGKKAGSDGLWGGLMSAKYYKEMWHQIKIDKKTFIGEISNKKKNGEEYIASTTISPILDEKGTVVFFIGIERDITHAKEVDKAKTEFVSLASHQLRTPLSAINWYTELLLSGDAGEVSTEQKTHLQEIYASSKRMVALVNALLNVSRIELGTFIVQPEQTDITALIKDVLNELEVSVQKKKLKIEEKFGNIPKINVDPKLTRIVFQNLLSNAVKYTPAKGTVSIVVKKYKKNTYFHSKRFTRSMITFVVSDTGYGIPKRQQHLLFQKLFRADNVKEKDADGTGLGLYIAKSIIEHSNGTIWFESEENKGTTFYVALPTTGMKQKKGTKQLD